MTKKIKQQISGKALCCIIAILAPMTVLAQGEIITYPGNGVLRTDLWGNANSLFPDELSDNSVTVNDDVSGRIYGGVSNVAGNVTNNALTINSGTLSNNIYGGYSQTGTATGNVVTLNGGNNSANVYGGYAYNGGTSNGNTISATGGTWNSFYGGGVSLGIGTANNNTVIVDGADVSSVAGGMFNATGGDASGNTVTLIKGSAINVNGGYSFSGNNGTANNNTVNLHAGFVFSGNLAGGNTVGSTGNTLNLHGWTGTIDYLAFFQNYNFFLPDNVKGGDAIITVDLFWTTINISNIAVDLDFEGTPPILSIGNQIILIDASIGGLTGEPTTTEIIVGGYTFALSVIDDKLIATVTAAPTISYTVTFSGESINIASQTVENGNLVIRPADPERVNYDFGGWFTDNGTFLNEWNFETDVVTQDTTLYAKWEETTRISEIENAGLKIYPNPVKNELRVESGELRINQVEIVDLSGKTIYKFHNPTNQINVSALSQGVYFVKIETDNGVVTRKFVKE